MDAMLGLQIGHTLVGGREGGWEEGGREGGREGEGGWGEGEGREGGREREGEGGWGEGEGREGGRISHLMYIHVAKIVSAPDSPCKHQCTSYTASSWSAGCLSS